MHEKDTEYMRSGPVPEDADAIADVMADWQRSLSNKLRELFPDNIFAILVSIKFADVTQNPVAPGTVIGFLPNDPEVAHTMLPDLIGALERTKSDPREPE